MAPQPKYRLEKDRFVIEHYNWAKPFSDFFPGIAGPWGIPLWVYFVSRGQGIISCGIQDKDNQILEFLSFNKAVQMVGSQGFRTFIKMRGEKVCEPFRKQENADIVQTLSVTSAEFTITEENRSAEYKIEVTYFPLVNFSVAGLIRQVRFQNIGSTKRGFEIIDGLPKIFCFGMDRHCVQVIPRHIEGMMQVIDFHGTPLYRLKQSPQDVERVTEIKGGHFYFTPGTKQYVVDPQILFGDSMDFETPWAFCSQPLQNILKEPQMRQNKTPSGFTPFETELSAGETFSFVSILGHAPSDSLLTDFIQQSSPKDFFEKKRRENKSLIDEIKAKARTLSADPAFDQYCEQTFLDNVVRGGMPKTFETAKGKSVFYLYSKQNGDLERDYHNFVIEPTYLSQGTGHYRSVLQNRRLDTRFFPEIGEANIKTFVDLIQTDGYNPLEVTSRSYRIEDNKGFRVWLEQKVKDPSKRKILTNFTEPSFTPGGWIMKTESLDTLKSNREETLSEILSFAEENEVGAVHEGFWVDHWLYNFDTIESFLSVYPDRLSALLFERTDYTFFDNPDIVRPRSEKYCLREGGVRQYGAVVRDREKEKMILSRRQNKHRVRTGQGKGDIYQTNLFVKLLCLVINRVATLDPENIGVEMEANKPGWNDSMNGLPGILGSSLCQTLELERACRFLSESLSNPSAPPPKEISFYEELAGFLFAINNVLEVRLTSQRANKRFLYWNQSNVVKEKYREQTRYGLSGKETPVSTEIIRGFFEKSLQLLREIYTEGNRPKVFHPNGTIYTYLINEMTEWEEKEGKIIPKAFRQKPVALFLEGPVHYLRVHPEKGKEVYASVKESPIYDRRLKMYKACESLEKEPFEIGRVKAWGPGWIENESVYTHMEYKYLLELLKAGLFEEFYNDIRTCLPPFLKPEVYGRPVTQNVSFIVSSAFPDPKLHGQGFQPRLSGVTCEWLHAWAFMTAGARPFFLNDAGELQFKLEPILADWLFTEQGTFSFRFLENTNVIYSNPKRLSTFGSGGVKVRSYQLTYRGGLQKTVGSFLLDTPLALDIRKGRVESLQADLN